MASADSTDEMSIGFDAGCWMAKNGRHRKTIAITRRYLPNREAQVAALSLLLRRAPVVSNNQTAGHGDDDVVVGPISVGAVDVEEDRCLRQGSGKRGVAGVAATS